MRTKHLYKVFSMLLALFVLASVLFIVENIRDTIQYEFYRRQLGNPNGHVYWQPPVFETFLENMKFVLLKQIGQSN